MRLIFRCEQTREVMKVVPPESWDMLPEGWFVGEYEYTGLRRYCRLTGRTRAHFGHRCPTIERFDIETYVEEWETGPTILGRPGARLPGMWATQPSNVKDGLVLA